MLGDNVYNVCEIDEGQAVCDRVCRVCGASEKIHTDGAVGVSRVRALSGNYTGIL